MAESRQLVNNQFAANQQEQNELKKYVNHIKHGI